MAKTKAGAGNREDTIQKLRATKDLDEKLKLQKILDGGRSPLLTTLQHLESQHGRKAVEEAIGQWDKHEKDGPLGPGGEPE